MIIGLVPVIIVTVIFILNFVHSEITACDSDNKQSLILSFFILHRETLFSIITAAFLDDDGFKSASIARSQVWLGLPFGRFPSDCTLQKFTSCSYFLLR